MKWLGSYYNLYTGPNLAPYIGPNIRSIVHNIRSIVIKEGLVKRHYTPPRDFNLNKFYVRFGQNTVLRLQIFRLTTQTFSRVGHR